MYIYIYISLSISIYIYIYGCQVLEKRLFGKIFFTSGLTLAREMPKIKPKNPGNMCQFIFLKIYPQQ